MRLCYRSAWGGPASCTVTPAVSAQNRFSFGCSSPILLRWAARLSSRRAGACMVHTAGNPHERKGSGSGLLTSRRWHWKARVQCQPYAVPLGTVREQLCQRAEVGEPEHEYIDTKIYRAPAFGRKRSERKSFFGIRRKSEEYRRGGKMPHNRPPKVKNEEGKVKRSQMHQCDIHLSQYDPFRLPLTKIFRASIGDGPP